MFAFVLSMPTIGRSFRALAYQSACWGAVCANAQTGTTGRPTLDACHQPC